MFTEKEHETALGGITVKEAHIGLQLLTKAASQGIIQPVEFNILGEWRTMLVTAIERAIGKNYDAEMAKLQQKAQQMAKQQADEQQTSSERQDTGNAKMQTEENATTTQELAQQEKA